MKNYLDFDGFVKRAKKIPNGCREVVADEPKFRAVHQYGHYVQRGWQHTGLKVDGQYVPGPKFVLEGAYYEIDGIRHEGVYNGYN